MNAGAWRGASKGRPRPSVSIITSTLNAGDALPHTMKSIRDANYERLEWLVIDGASTDGTVDLLAANDDWVIWKSEPDSGLYDAWNKACAKASGDWFLFLGAGDELAPGALEKCEAILARAFPAHSLVYGRTQYLSPFARQIIEEVGEPWEMLADRWELMRPALPQQNAVFHHRSLFDAGMQFDSTLTIAADAEMLLRAIAQRPPLFVHSVVSRVVIGGLSFRLESALEIRRQVREIDRRLGLKPPFTHVVADTLALGAKLFLGRFMPERVAYAAADAMRALQGKPRRWTVR